jgi:hypothetical protein
MLSLPFYFFFRIFNHAQPTTKANHEKASQAGCTQSQAADAQEGPSPKASQEVENPESDPAEKDVEQQPEKTTIPPQMKQCTIQRCE